MNKAGTLSLFFLLWSMGSSFAQSQLDKYVLYADENLIETLPDPSNIVTSPVDLDFHPDTTNRPDELWIINQGTENTGGHSVIFNNVNADKPRSRKVQDGNAWHFMALGSSMAFGANGNWASAQDIQDANHGGGTFTGPTLWSSDTTIYGVVGKSPSPQVNGSRLDSYHQSPFGKGIAYESGNTYWVMDGYSGTLKRYNFNDVTKPGELGDADTELIVYSDFSFTKNDELPAHIVIDENGKWLYGCDTEGKNVFRMDITSGSYKGDLTPTNNEPAASYEEYTGHTQEVLFDEGLNQPVGIDIQGDRLIISDFALGMLVLYDLEVMEEVGRISLESIPNVGVKGVKIGPDNKIYICDDENDQVHVLDNPKTIFPIGMEDAQDQTIRLFPNPVNESLNFRSHQEQGAYTILSTSGKALLSGTSQSGINQIPTNNLADGVYLLSLTSELGTTVQRFSVIR